MSSERSETADPSGRSADVTPEGEGEEGGPVGKRIRSETGRKLVTGNGEYAPDIDRKGMVHGRFVRSQHAHAYVTYVDTAEAEAMDGVVDVWTAEDVDPYVDVEAFGHPSLDHPDEEVLATDRVRYVGDEIALVLATDRNTAVRAADRVDVEYERLEAVTTVEEALAPDAPLVHPDLDGDPDTDVSGNVLTEYSLRAGDVGRAFEEADHVVEERFETNRTNPAPLEPHGCVAEYNPGDGRLELASSNQAPQLLANFLSDVVLDLDERDVVARMPDVGGGFGAKVELMTHEVCATAASIATERPVKIVLDRIEEMQAGRGRNPETFDARLALDGDGSMVGFDVDIRQNTGAYGSFGKAVLTSSVTCGAGPYLIPNQRIDAEVVYTNVMPSSACRGYGDPQFAFAREGLIDVAARELGLDPVELRLRNVPGPDDFPLVTSSGLKWNTGDMPACLRAVRDRIDRPSADGTGRVDGTDGADETHRADGTDGTEGEVGVGFAAFMRRGGSKGPFGKNFESAIVEMDRKGQVTLRSGIASIGQGTETGIAQLAADTLGVSTDRVRPIVGDSEKAPRGLGAWGDRGAMIGGTAAARAAEDLKDTIVRLSARFLDVPRGRVRLADDRVFEAGNPENGMGIEEFADRAFFGDEDDRPPDMRDGVSLIGEAKFESRGEGTDPDTNTGNIAHGYSFGALAVAVAVDPDTGEITVEDLAFAEDAGTIINPMLVEGQIHGGIVHALGETLLEDYRYDGAGNLLNGTLVDYHLPTAADVPVIDEEKLIHVETPDPNTSHGQKGVAESSIVPVSGAVANAVHDATGIRFRDLPLSQDRVLPRLSDR